MRSPAVSSWKPAVAGIVFAGVALAPVPPVYLVGAGVVILCVGLVVGLDRVLRRALHL